MMEADLSRRGLALVGLTAAGTLAVCQATSYLVHSRLPLDETRFVTRFLHFTHIRNTGGVFGMFQGHPELFGLLSAVIIVAGIAYMLSERGWARHQYVCFGLIVGAAASNVCDRLVYGAVIDFLDVQGIPHWHYVFNPADVAIHLGAWPLAFGALLGKR